jgi:hypothetical protein
VTTGNFQLATLVTVTRSSDEDVFGLLKGWFAVSKSASNSVIAMFLLLVSVRFNKHGL